MEQDLMDEHTEKLWRDVVHETEDNLVQDKELSKSSTTIKDLRHLCGKLNCSFTPHENLSLLLRVDSIRKEISTDNSVGISILTNYSLFAHQSHCMKTLENIVRSALSAPSSDARNCFLKLVWNHFGFQCFPIMLIEEFIFKESQLLEEDLFDLFLVSLTENVQTNVWENHKYQPLLSWCSKSAKLFALVTSVLNSLSVKTCEKSSYSNSLEIVQKFVHSVKLKCTVNKTDFVLLYPREYHTLVMFLNIHPEMFSRVSDNQLSVTMETVIDLVKRSITSKPTQSFTILTHFPEWAKFVS